jgi:hypothetical protein
VSYRGTEASGELKDVGNLGSADHEVSTTTESLAMDLSRHVVYCLDESLVPLADGAGEVGSLNRSTDFVTVRVNE